jgi:hypothetical protein
MHKYRLSIGLILAVVLVAAPLLHVTHAHGRAEHDDGAKCVLCAAGPSVGLDLSVDAGIHQVSTFFNSPSEKCFSSLVAARVDSRAPPA